MSEATEIQKSLEELDTSNIERQTVISENPTKDCLVVKLDNELELKFIRTLCNNLGTSDSKINNLDIDVWAQVAGYLKPIGTMPLLFDNVQKIHSYNPDIKVGLYSVEKNKIFRLNITEELCLP